jgi:RNA polymerase sigma factor (TIGR02999 family)
MPEMTQLLSAVEKGDACAAEQLLPLVYDELRKLAAHKMSLQPPGQTLQATALVHEAYLRLVGGEEKRWESRRHFFNAAAEAMRRILVDHARKRGRKKRGGQRQRVSLEVVDIATSASSEQILAVDDAIRKLEQQEPRLGQVVKLRFLAGLSEEETAKLLGVAERTVRRDWQLARAWRFFRTAPEPDGVRSVRHSSVLS